MGMVLLEEHASLILLHGCLCELLDQRLELHELPTDRLRLRVKLGDRLAAFLMEDRTLGLESELLSLAECLNILRDMQAQVRQSDESFVHF